MKQAHLQYGLGILSFLAGIIMAIKGNNLGFYLMGFGVGWACPTSELFNMLISKPFDFNKPPKPKKLGKELEEKIKKAKESQSSPQSVEKNSSEELQ